MSGIINGINQIGVEVGSGATSVSTYVIREIEIGDWNMDSSSTSSVIHGLSTTEWKTVKNSIVTIRNDDDNEYYKLEMCDTSGNNTGGSIISIGSTVFNLARITGGFFDSTSFDSTSYNRGWVTFFYQPD